jgi:hypothetical protein
LFADDNHRIVFIGGGSNLTVQENK